MSLSAAALALAALAYPELGENFWGMVISRRVGDLIVEVYAAPDGRVDECEVVYSDFSPAEDDRFCNTIRQKEVAKPAYDQFGKPVHGTAIFRFSTTLGADADPVILQREANVEVGVSALPGGLDKLNVGLRVLVDETGKIEACEPDTRPADAYTRVACEQAALYPQRIRRDRKGKPARHVTNIAVEFVKAPAAG